MVGQSLRRRAGLRADADGLSAPASSPSELAPILTASDDNTRPATKQELDLLRLNISAMCTSLREYIADEFRQRDAVDTLMATRLAALEAQTTFQQGALAEPREQSARQSGVIFKMMQISMTH